MFLTIEGAICNIEYVLPTLIEGYECGVETGKVQQPLRKDLLEALKQTLDDTKHSVSYAQSTIEMILSGFHHVSAIMPSNEESFPVQKAVEQAIKIYPFQEKEQLLISIEPIDDVTVFGRAAVITYVLHNLIKNALYAIEAAEKGKIVIWSKREENQLILYVKDTAGGIETSQLERIFEPFYTTKSKTAQSIGLGLYFCKIALERMGATIICDSIIEQYTCFLIKLTIK